jgi:hypothetical protein
VGTNPRFRDLAQALPTPGLRALVWRESGGRQFDAPPDGGAGPCPLFSRDLLGGVGLMQVTRPAPTAEQTWNWRANVAAGVALYREKERVARGYPARVRASARFAALSAQYAASRRGAGAAAAVTPSLHEFRVALDADGRLVVREEGGRALARWERVPASARPAAGDPNYVAHVLSSRPPF